MLTASLLRLIIINLEKYTIDEKRIDIKKVNIIIKNVKFESFYDILQFFFDIIDIFYK